MTHKAIYQADEASVELLYNMMKRLLERWVKKHYWYAYTSEVTNVNEIHITIERAETIDPK